MGSDQGEASKDPWKLLRYFLGDWQGVGGGKPGESNVERNYELVLNDQFIKVYTRSVFEPQEKNTEGEIHEEIGFFSYDKVRGLNILREFHVEGFVNQYTVEKGEEAEKTLVMTTEAIENIPEGWQARTTYQIMGPDEFQETFELMGPGRDWACFITNQLMRVKKD